MNTTLAISTRGLTKRYKQTTAVNNLDLDIPRGTIFGFLGPNGAGKTTTIRMLLGLVKPSAGNAQVLGHDIEHERHFIAPKVGAIVESPMFYTYLTGEQNLEVLARSANFSVDAARISKLIDRVGLTGRGRHKIKTYSLGMKQRLGIAATLLSDPEIVFLDEPTNGLDPAGTVDMRNQIKELGSEGRTVFLSSHLLNEVEQVCTDVAIIQHGVTRLQGRVHDLLSTGSGFAIEAKPVDKALALLSEYPELEARRSDNGWIHITVEPANVPPLVRALVSANVDVFQVQVRRNTLEDLFLELTSQPNQ